MWNRRVVGMIHARGRIAEYEIAGRILIS